MRLWWGGCWGAYRSGPTGRFRFCRALTQGFTLGYFHILPTGRIGGRRFVVSHSCPDIFLEKRVKDGAPSSMGLG